MKSILVLCIALGFVWLPLGRTADSDTVAGKWHFVLDTPGGDRESNSVFEQTDGKVTGKWSVEADGKGGDTVAGTYAAKKLALEFTINPSETSPGTMKIDGLLAADGTLSGEWAFGDYSGTFKATRVKEPAK